MVEIKSCPVCSGTSLKPFTSCIDYTVSHETFYLLQCNSCSLVITSPRPDNANLSNYYLSEKYISHTSKAHTITDRLYLLVRRITLRTKLNLLAKYTINQKRLLDYGCGTGSFLKYCQSSGWDTTGVEPSAQAREKAISLTEREVYASINQLTQKRFDVITLWHVLEHVPDLESTLDKLYSLLNENGTIFIAVPNYESFDAQYYNECWAGYDVPRHLWHFSQRSMLLLLNKRSLTLEKIVPMKFDSFYVSLLSEKYKNKESASVFGMIKAFINGMISNVKGSNTGNYSSLIYIARK